VQSIMFFKGVFKVKLIVQGQTHYHVHSISLNPLVAFAINSTQMSSMMRQCAVGMSDQGRFKVKVIIQR